MRSSVDPLVTHFFTKRSVLFDSQCFPLFVEAGVRLSRTYTLIIFGQNLGLGSTAKRQLRSHELHVSRTSPFHSRLDRYSMTVDENDWIIQTAKRFMAFSLS